MKLRLVVKKIIEKTGYTIKKISPVKNPDLYDEDGFNSFHNHDFINDPNFINAYSRGITAAADYGFRWRVHIGTWAGFTASKLTGDFIECGVNKGFMSSAIMNYINWNSLNKTFYLMDTFAGLDEKYVTEEEKKRGVYESYNKALKDGFFINGIDSVIKNFSEWHNVRIIQGSIPDTLPKVKTKKVAYLHIDMNCAPPEVAALEYFWEKLVTGAIVLFDDYGFPGHIEQKNALDEVVKKKKAKIASLPTGQGLLIKT